MENLELRVIEEGLKTALLGMNYNINLELSDEDYETLSSSDLKKKRIRLCFSLINSVLETELAKF